ncbi:hypothetical protein [Streptomyces sp. NPDC003717]|uniref:hypothetical protein n=1 Tax=Streptomyces sp. NPDC003717 TaxID=3154276 RepID=UPI0033BF7D65
MRVDDTGRAGPTVTADLLLGSAEAAFLKAEFPTVGPVLRRIDGEFGTPADADDAARYSALRAALAARAGNWPEAVRRCPEPAGLEAAATGVLHALALSALRRLGEDGGHAEPGVAGLAIVLWAHLLDDDDESDFRGLLTRRRGAPVADDHWDDARRQLLGRITDLLRALDARAGRDVLAAWETAWAAERVWPAVILPDVGADGLVPLGDAAHHLVDDGAHLALLDAYLVRHPDPVAWTAGSPEHRACAPALARALSGRGRDRAAAKEWSAALADFEAAVRLGRVLGADEQAAVRRAGNNVGRRGNGGGHSPVTRIQGLEVAHALVPQDAALAAELTAVLVRRGQEVEKSDPAQSRRRFARALAVSPRDQGARSGLDGHLRADLERALDGVRGADEPTADEVVGLLARDPDCAPARKWLRDHYARLAVGAASRGRTAEARAAAGLMLQHDGGEDSHAEETVSRALVGLLLEAARRPGEEGARSGLERAVDLLDAALAAAVSPDRGRVREELDAVLLRLAEHLEATASPSDVIELFLRDRMRTGVDARFDLTVETAYLRRARAREREGDLGGARRDLACAQRIGACLPTQISLFETAPAPDAADGHDTGQGTFF